ncbi:MAG: GWxTD domain-containing protein, partial [Calditrichaeota bacterium]|nr:GWxTD domain-containing protein [Calditrichota bacterium]
ISRLDKLSLADLQTGVYRLKVQVIDIASNTGASLQKYFRVVTGQESEGMLLPMGKTDIQKYAKQIQYLASSEEKALFHSLDSRGKQAFLLQFWRSRDTTPETPENEFMMEYFKRIAYCDAHFTNGISSDQGRIYLKYGEPMEIQRFKASTQYTKPVEIWIYAVEGTSEFVFVDRIGGDQFTLMHSSHPDEYHNPDWAETLQ